MNLQNCFRNAIKIHSRWLLDVLLTLVQYTYPEAELIICLTRHVGILRYNFVNSLGLFASDGSALSSCHAKLVSPSTLRASRVTETSPQTTPTIGYNELIRLHILRFSCLPKFISYIYFGFLEVTDDQTVCVCKNSCNYIYY